MNPRRAIVGAVVLLAVSLFRPGSAAGQIMDTKVYTFVLFDELEGRYAGDNNGIHYDMLGWVGGDFTRIWLKAEGTQSTVGGGGDVEVQALYSRLVAPFWEWQVGAQLEADYGSGSNPARAQAVIGLQGLAPYWFELEPAVFVSQDGDISAQITATYDMFLTQRLIAQPRGDLRAAVQEVPEFGVGSGLNSLRLGLRLRYELRREFAPYVGVTWGQRFGGTADLARKAGAPVSDLAALVGVRLWF